MRKWISTIALGLLGTLLLSACNLFGPPSNPGHLGEEPTVQGKVQNWTGEEAQVVALSGATEIARGTINSQGEFQLGLKTPPEHILQRFGDYSTPPGCEDNVQISDNNAKITAIYFNVVNNGNSTGSLLLANKLTEYGPENGLKVGQYTYADRNVSVKGTVTCAGNGYEAETKFDLSLAKGWNLIINELTVSGTKLSTKIYVGAPGDLKWWYKSY